MQVYKKVKALTLEEQKSFYDEYVKYFDSISINRRNLHITKVDALIIRSMKEEGIFYPTFSIEQIDFLKSLSENIKNIFKEENISLKNHNASSKNYAVNRAKQLLLLPNNTSIVFSSTEISILKGFFERDNVVSFNDFCRFMELVRNYTENQLSVLLTAVGEWAIAVKYLKQNKSF